MAITNKDIEKMREVFATKEDLNRFATKEDLSGKFEKVLSGQDKIIKELEKAREDRTLAIGKDREQDQRIGSLETRVKAIEVKVGSPFRPVALMALFAMSAPVALDPRTDLPRFIGHLGW